MRLLIVEDEEMTRNGLVHSLPWKEIGITEILQEKDGAAGLKTALNEHPEIILCDIRMPRMDGLTMLERIHETHPDIVSVLLTGHAEVEYLKKAIFLGVIRFVEKPVNLDELTEALKKAVEKVVSHQRQKESAQIHSTVVASRLAYQMTVPYDSCADIIDHLLKDFMIHYGTDKFRYITTVIVRPEQLPPNSGLFYNIGQKLHDRLVPGHYHILYTDRLPQEIVYQIYGSILPAPGTLKMIGDIILSYYKDYTRCYVSLGRSVVGIRNAWHSYTDARYRLRQARFYEPDTLLFAEESESGTENNDSRLPSVETERANERITAIPDFYRTALEDHNEDRALKLLEEFRRLWYHSMCGESVVKSAYYSMFMALSQVSHAQHISVGFPEGYSGLIIDEIDSAFSFLEIDEKVQTKTSEFFYSLSHNQNEGSTIYRIKEYVNNHYTDPELSVKTISEYIFLSVSYLCTYFKNETGITLNQYITDFRIRKAMQILQTTNMKIVNVANAVGYRDSNYFAKIFKKQTGLSPKEYKNRS